MTQHTSYCNKFKGTHLQYNCPALMCKTLLPTCCTTFIVYCCHIFRSQSQAIFIELHV